METGCGEIVYVGNRDWRCCCRFPPKKIKNKKRRNSSKENRERSRDRETDFPYKIHLVDHQTSKRFKDSLFVDLSFFPICFDFVDTSTRTVLYDMMTPVPSRRATEEQGKSRCVRSFVRSLVF